VKPPLLIHLGVMGVWVCLVAPAGAGDEPGAPVAAEPGTFASVELRPGRFAWHGEPASDRPLDIVVSIPRQMLYLLDDVRLVAVSSVSTGRRGHSTPTGAFTVLQKQKKHFSNLYDNAPMPYMQRLTWGGVALHAGQIPGYPASHGCIRLPRAFAEQLYGVTRIGSRVVVTGEAFPPTAPMVPSLTDVLVREWRKLHPDEMVALNDAPAPIAAGVPEAGGKGVNEPVVAETTAFRPDQGSSAIADSSRP